MNKAIDISKLPKYAQEEIVQLRRKVEELRNTLAQERQTEPTRIRWGYKMMKDDAFGYIPDRETVFFYLADNSRDVIRFRFEKDGVNVNAGGRLLIECGSSNDVLLKVQP